MPDFIHLHCHTQYSLLDGASSISKMMEKAVKDDMKAVALTDHGNMFGAFKFVAEAEKNKLKPIVGCEFYLVEDRHKKPSLMLKARKTDDFTNCYWQKTNRATKIFPNFVPLVSLKACTVNIQELTKNCCYNTMKDLLPRLVV
jgi:DNA polymerase III alpha subunit